MTGTPRWDHQNVHADDTRPTLGLDLDGVVACFSTAFQAVAERLANRPLPVTEWWLAEHNVPYDALTLTSDKHTLTGLTVLVDDMPLNVERHDSRLTRTQSGLVARLPLGSPGTNLPRSVRSDSPTIRSGCDPCQPCEPGPGSAGVPVRAGQRREHRPWSDLGSPR